MRFLVAPALCGLSLLLAAPAFADSTKDCRIGSYQLSSGQAVDIGPSDGDTLRWRLWDGETGQLHPQKDGAWTSTSGWTGRPDGKTVSFSDCDKGEITFDKKTGTRIPFDVTNTTFESGGVKLAGRLVMPKGSGRVPVVVLIHGSEHDSALDYYSLQRMFPAQG
ncbi:MAG: alpha/beta hydrolase family protein, partial [Rhizomicrobium sp.]